MKGCNYIRELIDEADKPDLLPFEVTQHFAQCQGCERFASERSALRTLVASSTRVSAPVNFDAVLNARLAEVKARRSFWWLGSPVYFRLGAATAGLVIMFFAAQYAGLLSQRSGNRPNQPIANNGSESRPFVTPQEPAIPKIVVPPAKGRDTASSVSLTVRSRRGYVAASRVAPPVYLSAEDGGVVLVRGQNGEMDVQMPTVSVGAQPLMYVRAGQRTVSNVGASF